MKWSNLFILYVFTLRHLLGTMVSTEKKKLFRKLFFHDHFASFSHFIRSRKSEKNNAKMRRQKLKKITGKIKFSSSNIY